MPSAAEDSFVAILSGLRKGDAAAAARVHADFAHRLVALAQQRLGERARRKTTPDDVVQSVFGSFFGRFPRGQWDLADRDGLWALLVEITVHKCLRQARHFGAQRRDAGREVGLQVGDDSACPADPPAAEPTPEQAVILSEMVQLLLDGLPAGRERDIVQLRLQGFQVAEISRLTNVPERTVERRLLKVRDRLQQYLAQG